MIGEWLARSILRVGLAASLALGGGACVATSSGVAPKAGAPPARGDGVEAGRLARIEEKLDRIAVELARLADVQERLVGATEAPVRRVGAIEIGDSPSRGPEDAPVTIVAFADFECPYCASVVPTMERLLDEYDGAIRYVFKHFPLPYHKKAVLAHRVATRAAEEGRFWEMYRRLYESQDRLDPDDLRAHAEAVGLDVADFDDFVASNEGVDVIQDDRALARDLGVRGVPAFFINGRFIAGAQPREVFREIIEEELAVPDGGESGR